MTTLTRSAPNSAGQMTGATPITFAALVRAVPGWLARHRSRRNLMQLDAHMLRDIGLSLEDASVEAAKPFWRP
jgi:uncharacterized protein YjiS (DUF1127 family)